MRTLALICAMCQAFRAADASTVCTEYGTDLATDAGVVRALEYLDDGTNKMLAAGGEDHILRVWTFAPTFSATYVPFYGHQETIWSLEWISDHDLLASASGDGTIHFWPISVLTATQTCSGVADCCDGSGLGCEGEHVVSYRDAGMTVRRQVFSLHWTGSVLISGWGDGVIRTWTYNGAGTNPSWTFQNAITIAEGDRPYGLQWMTGVSLLAMISPDWPHPRLWDDPITDGTYTYLSEDLGVNGGFGLYPHAHNDGVLDLDVNSAGDMVATGSKDFDIILWSGSAKDRTAKLSGHTGYVASVAWMEGLTVDYLVSGSGDNTIKIWDMSDTTADQSSALQELSTHTGQVNDLVWFHSGSISEGNLASGGADGYVKLFSCADP